MSWLTRASIGFSAQCGVVAFQATPKSLGKTPHVQLAAVMTLGTPGAYLEIASYYRGKRPGRDDPRALEKRFDAAAKTNEMNRPGFAGGPNS